MAHGPQFSARKEAASHDHSEREAAVAVSLGRVIELSEEQIRDIALGAWLRHARSETSSWSGSQVRVPPALLGFLFGRR